MSKKILPILTAILILSGISVSTYQYSLSDKEKNIDVKGPEEFQTMTINSDSSQVVRSGKTSSSPNPVSSGVSHFKRQSKYKKDIDDVFSNYTIYCNNIESLNARIESLNQEKLRRFQDLNSESYQEEIQEYSQIAKELVKLRTTQILCLQDRYAEIKQIGVNK